MRRTLVGGGSLAVLWIGLGGAAFALQAAGGALATIGELVPSPMRYGVLGLPVAWTVLVQALIVLTLVAGFAALAGLLSRSGRTGFAAAWLAAILPAFLVGASLDLGSFAAWAGRFGIRGALGTMGVAPQTAWWGVAVGWIPAWILAGGRGAVAREGAADRHRDRRPPIALAVIAIVAAFALPFTAQAGHAAAQDELRQEQADAQANADPDGAAPADPDAQGEPVPAIGSPPASVPDGACTAEDTTILAPSPDAATGHRGQALQLVNTSDAPCVVDGYPDVAYGDQNGHLLPVALEHGGSFMAQDPGPSPITLQPGDAASAVIGWDANSVHGQLAARTLWVAAYAGTTRLRWDVSLDIIPGATVTVTAWHAAIPRA